MPTGCSLSAAETPTPASNMPKQTDRPTAKRIMSKLLFLLITKARNHRGLLGERSLQIAGGDEQAACVQHGAAVDHAGRFHFGMTAQVQRPVLGPIISSQRMDHALE